MMISTLNSVLAIPKGNRWPVRRLRVKCVTYLEKLEELRAKKQEQQDWDKFTTSQKSSVANIDDKIAKNLAD